MNRIQELRNKLEQEKGKYAQTQNWISTLQETMKEEKKELERAEQAREIIREVGLETQKQLQFHISDITSLALEAVF